VLHWLPLSPYPSSWLPAAAGIPMKNRFRQWKKQEVPVYELDKAQKEKAHVEQGLANWNENQ